MEGPPGAISAFYSVKLCNLIHILKPLLRMPATGAPLWYLRFNVYSRNLGSAVLHPEPINRLPERSGDVRNFERDKGSPKQAIRPVSPEQPDYAKLTRYEQGNGEY